MMRHPTTINITSIITLFWVFLLVPFTSHADMQQELRDVERDARHLKQRRQQHASDSELLKSTERNRKLEFRRISHRQVRREQRDRSRPPKTPERILDKFITRIQHSAVAVITNMAPDQHISDEQAVEPVAISPPVHQHSSFFSESPSLPETVSLHTLSVLRL